MFPRIPRSNPQAVSSPDRFQLDPQQPVEMKTLRREPLFQLFASRRVEFNQHLSLMHVDEDPPRANAFPVIHALRQFLRTLTCEAGKGMLRDVSSHSVSCRL